MLRLISILLVAGCAATEPSDTATRWLTAHTPAPPDAPLTYSRDEILTLRTLWPLPQVPEDPTNWVADDPWAQHLGQYLFFDTDLSSTGEISCASCHDPELGWADGQRLSQGLGPTLRHSPSLLNNGHNRWFFWDGRCDNAWCQALQPLENDHELGSNRLAVVHEIAQDPDLSSAYAEIFGPIPDLSDPDRFPANARPVSEDPKHPEALAWAAMRPEDRTLINQIFANIGKCIAAFERRIVSRDSAWDRYASALLTDDTEGLNAIDDTAIEGLKIFIGEGRCFFCHSGPTFSNLEFHNVGLDTRRWIEPGDQGRAAGIVRLWDDPFNGTGNYSDDPEGAVEKIDYLSLSGEQAGQFKVPGLRDITTTAPYMHGGHFLSLTQVLRHYGDPSELPEFGHREDLLLEVSLDDSQIAALEAFLHTLSGAPLDPALTQAPDSPHFEP